MPLTASADLPALWAATASIYMLYNVLNCAHLVSAGRSTFFTSQYQLYHQNILSLPTHYPNYQIELVSFHTIQS
jgi:predicted Abi (CAAX) family protease